MKDDQCVEFNQLFILAWLWVATIVGVAIGLYLSTWVFPEVDSHAAIRPIAMRFPAAMLFSMWTMTVMVLWDLLTPGNTLEQINSDPKSAAIFFSVLVASIAYMVSTIV